YSFHQRRRRSLVPDDLAALHHKFHALKFGDIRQGIAGNGDEVRVFAFLDGTDAIGPAQNLSINNGARLNGLSGRYTSVLDEGLEFERLRAVRKSGAIDTTADHHFQTLRLSRYGDCSFKNGDHTVLATGVFVIDIVHVRFDISGEGRLVIESLFDDHIGLFLIEVIGVLDRVAPRQDGVMFSFSAQNVASGLVSELVGFVDQRFQYGLGVHQYKLCIAGRCE